MFCTMLSIVESLVRGFFFLLRFAFVTEVLDAELELCLLFSLLMASAFRKSSSVVLGEYSRDVSKASSPGAKGNTPLRPR